LKIRSAHFIKSATSPQGYPGTGLPEVAFIGKSNVGKSSLINSLLKKRGLAKTSKTPGRTRVINFFNVNEKLIFVDLPGYGFAHVPEGVRKSWQSFIEAYFRERQELVFSLLLIDSRHDPTENDRLMKSWLDHEKQPFMVVFTKSDKLGRGRLHQQIARSRKLLDLKDETQSLAYSCMTDQGRIELLKFLYSLTTFKNRGKSAG
jgi:GTP-binding protein